MSSPWPYSPDVHPEEREPLREPSRRYYIASAALVAVIVVVLGFVFYVGLMGAKQ